MTRRPLPTALFALSDEMAFGAVIAARELGIDIPGDVSLVGVDDHEAAEVMGLTTVRQGVVGHGARAAAALLRSLGGEGGAPFHDVRPIELVVRQSTRPARVLDPGDRELQAFAGSGLTPGRQSVKGEG